MKKRRKSRYAQTLSELFENFIEDCRLNNLSDKTIENYTYNCNLFIEAIDDIEVKNLNQDVLDNFMKWLDTNRNYNATSKNSMFVMLNVYLHWLYEKEFIYDKLTFNKIKTDNKVKEIYTNEELRRILRKPSEDCLFSEYRNYLIAHTILNLGLRVGTLSEIRVSDIDMKNKTLTLHKMKNRQEKIMSIPKPLYKVLKEYFQDYDMNDDDYLICDDKGQKMKSASITTSFKRYCKNMNIYKEGSVHLLRHTYATKFIKNGGSIYALSKILGHSSVAITETYLRTLNVEQFKEELEQYNPILNL